MNPLDTLRSERVPNSFRSSTRNENEESWQLSSSMQGSLAERIGHRLRSRQHQRNAARTSKNLTSVSNNNHEATNTNRNREMIALGLSDSVFSYDSRHY